MPASRRRPGVLRVVAATLVVAAPAGAPTAAGARSGDPTDLITLATSPDPLHVEGFAPGDNTEWTGHITNLTDRLLDLRLAMGAGATPLTADPKQGLQLSLAWCSQPWTPTTAAGATTFSCAGTYTSITARPVPAATVAAAGYDLGRLDPKATADLRMHVDLPVTADNSYERLAATLAIEVSATIDGEVASRPTRKPRSDELARTGADVTDLTLLGLATLGAGLALLVAGRDRRRSRRAQP